MVRRVWVTRKDSYPTYLFRGILHDEKLYGPKTEEFEPERFLRPGIKPPTSQFGFGRRIYAGRYLADNTLFITVASVLKAFDISLARDDNGNEIPVKAAWTSGFLS
jgi:cytochrome P450